MHCRLLLVVPEAYIMYENKLIIMEVITLHMIITVDFFMKQD